MKKLLGVLVLALVVGAGGCGKDKSTSSVMEDAGFKTLRNGTTVDLLEDEESWDVYVFEIDKTKIIRISITGSEDILFNIYKFTSSGWVLYEGVDENEDRPDVEVFSGALTEGRYQITISAYDEDRVSYTMEVSM